MYSFISLDFLPGSGSANLCGSVTDTLEENNFFQLLRIRTKFTCSTLGATFVYKGRKKFFEIVWNSQFSSLQFTRSWNRSLFIFEGYALKLLQKEYVFQKKAGKEAATKEPKKETIKETDKVSNNKEEAGDEGDDENIFFIPGICNICDLSLASIWLSLVVY